MGHRPPPPPKRPLRSDRETSHLDHVRELYAGGWIDVDELELRIEHVLRGGNCNVNLAAVERELEAWREGGNPADELWKAGHTPPHLWGAPTSPPPKPADARRSVMGGITMDQATRALQQMMRTSIPCTHDDAIETTAFGDASRTFVCPSCDERHYESPFPRPMMETVLK